MAWITEINLNGTIRRVNADAERSLLSVLREDLDLTGTKFGCGEGQCGACTVLIDGLVKRACLTNVGEVAGKSITTIEGLAKNGKLHPLQQAFLDLGAMQCGYCTSGMIMGGVAFLRKNPKPSEKEIILAMEGHICRCGTYPRIVTAIAKAAQARAEGAR